MVEVEDVDDELFIDEDGFVLVEVVDYSDGEPLANAVGRAE
jgi:hypothetical protein